jgi:hypothetical protein
MRRRLKVKASMPPEKNIFFTSIPVRVQGLRPFPEL